MARKNGFGWGIGRYGWVLYALVAVLIIASMIQSQYGTIPEWEKCRESLIEQMFSDQCTPRRGFESLPTPGSGTGQNI